MRSLIYFMLILGSSTSIASDKCLGVAAVSAIKYIESTPKYHKGNLDVHVIFSQDMNSASLKDINKNIEPYELTGAGYMGEGISNYQFSGSKRVITIDVNANTCKILRVSSFLKKK